MKGLSKARLSDMVAESIVEFILDNKLQPGDAIPTEKEIAEKLQIGKTSVREGIAQLKAAGLLQSHQGGRVYVRETTLEDYLKPNSSLPLYRFLSLTHQQELDIISVRRLLETAALRQAAQRDIKGLTKCLGEIVQDMHRNQDSLEVFVDRDAEFHRQILIQSGNSVLPIIYDVIWGLYWRQFRDFALLPQAMERALDFHTEIVRQLEGRRIDEAVSGLAKHLSDMETRLTEELRAGPNEAQEQEIAKNDREGSSI